MNVRASTLVGFAAASLAIASTANAEIKLTDKLSIAGYAAGSYRYTEASGTSLDTFDIDASKISFLTNFAPVTGHFSTYYTGGGNDLTMLDVYVSYDFGDGHSITGGKFLSWLGYEAFDIPNMTQISYANGDFLAPIPGYHSGLKYNYTSAEWSGGVALLDAVYGATALKADGSLRDDYGAEAFLSYTGVKDLTLWAGIAYQSEGFGNDEVTTYDVWASYKLSDSLTVAAEYVFKQSDTGSEGDNFLLFANYTVDPKTSVAFRVSGEDVKNGPGFFKGTISPAYKVSDNLLVRGEVSYYDYFDSASLDNSTFVGVQGVFTF